MFCLNCGAQLPDNAKFCNKCGKPQTSVFPINATVLEKRENKIQPGEKQPEKTSFEVCLLSIGPNKINVINAVKATTSLSLKECKDFVESTPATMSGLSKEDAESIRNKMVTAGAVVEIR